MPVDLFAGVRVRDYQAAKSWYERLLDSEPAFSPHATEAVWEIAEHRYLFIVEDRDAPGRATITIFVDDLDARIPSRDIPAHSGRRVASSSAPAIPASEVDEVECRWGDLRASLPNCGTGINYLSLAAGCS